MKDICENRHGGAPTSVDAFERIEKALPAARREVLGAIRREGDAGTHLKHVCRVLDKEKNEVSGRISELKKAGLIEQTGARREGCAVVRAVDWRQGRLF